MGPISCTGTGTVSIVLARAKSALQKWPMQPSAGGRIDLFRRLLLAWSTLFFPAPEFEDLRTGTVAVSSAGSLAVKPRRCKLGRGRVSQPSVANG